MKDKGWIKLHRKIKEHWLWSSDKRLKWWIDVILTVNHADAKVLIKGTLVDVGRGQSVKSLQNWAQDWNVSKKTVSDFFKLLQKDEMIFVENLKITTRITVCNYDSYNDSVNATETLSKRNVNAKETQSKRERYTNKNDKNDKNEIKEEKPAKQTNSSFDFKGFDETEQQVLKQWIAYRAEIKKPIRQSALQVIRKDFTKHGVKKMQWCFELSIKNGWQGYFTEKIESEYKTTFPY